MKLLALPLILLLGACSNAPATALQADAAQPAPWVEADYTKPGPPVTLAHREVKRVESGSSPEVELRVGGLAPDSVVAVEFGTTEGLELLGTQRRLVRTNATGTALLRVDVRALGEGRHYLDVAAGTGEMGMRRMSVPVQVGDIETLPKPSPGTVVEGSGGQRILVMDAEETVDGVPQ